MLATKRHQTPLGVRLIVLFGIYMFAVLYPASLLQRIGFDVSVGYVFVMTFFKAFLFICLYNIQCFLKDPFNPNGVDSIRLQDFENPLLSEMVPVLKSADTPKMQETILTATAVPPDALNQV